MQPDIVHATLIGEAGDCATGVGVAVYDDEGRLVAVNEHTAKMLGYSRDELLARDIGSFTDGGFDRKRLFDSAIREGVRLVQRKDGSTFPAAFVVSPTRVARLAYSVAFTWELAADDPRAREAT
jgi:PAS domain S-box-containing protein